MLGFINSIWHKFTGAISEVYHWVLGIIAAVYSYVDRLWRILEADYFSVYHALLNFSRDVARWVTATVDGIFRTMGRLFHDVYVWAARIIDDVRSFAVHAYQWTVRTFDWILAKLGAAITDLVRWIVQHIWDPLYNGIMSAIHWITKYGLYVYDVISHPEKLMALLAHWLALAWLDILKRWALPISRFILNQTRRLAPDFISILEDVISKVL
jgi:hypothetical protein